MHDRIRLDGRVAVVTGAAGVIGTATMRLLAERGAHIVAVDRKQMELQTASEHAVIGLTKIGHASEVASIVAFLASDEASYVSGSAYTVDGGRTAS
jgi:NAD(P)-dependent dehydrogenase (short-subunit alcohol dehydrogenase family)